MNESEFREGLKAVARDFTPQARLPKATTRRARRLRLLRSVSMIGALVIAVATPVFVMSLTQVESEPHPTTVALTLDLSSYYDDGRNGAAPIPDKVVMEHIACMRREGFDVPTPTRSGNDWFISVSDPTRLGVGTKQWREAVFVTCRPPQPRGSGDLVFSVDVLPAEELATFRRCMANQGFDLPAPRLTEHEVWRFQIDGIELSSDAWNRALFVACDLDARP